MTVIRQMLQCGLDPVRAPNRGAYCESLCADAVLSNCLIVPTITREGSFTTALDNTPRRLLQFGDFGLYVGVLASRRQAPLGVHSVSEHPVQYEIHNGKRPNDPKKPPNVMTSHRPVVAGSPATSFEAQPAKVKQDLIREALALHPPEYYACRGELKAVELAVACHATCTASLESLRLVAHCGWYECNFFLQRQRDLTSRLNSRPQPIWDFGPWTPTFMAACA